MPASDLNMPLAGDVVDDRYRIEGKLGAGGFGVVFRARDERTGAAVAIKVLDASRSEDERSAARFRREIDLVARLQHPNTIRVTDCGQTARGSLYLVMELLTGEPLDVVLSREGALSFDRVTAILRQVLRSLSEAHAAGVVHRDLKPENIFLARIGSEVDVVKVLDFGIAKSTDDDEVALTSTSEIPCSPRYVAPERIVSNETHAGSDLYSLGVLALELLEGRPPFDLDNSMGLLMMHADPTTPVPISNAVAAHPIGDVLRRAVMKDPAARFTSADEMLRALDAACAPRAQGSTVPNPANGTTAPDLALAATVTEAVPHATDAPSPSTAAEAPPGTGASSGAVQRLPTRGARVAVALAVGVVGLVAAGVIMFVAESGETASGEATLADRSALQEPVRAPHPPGMVGSGEGTASQADSADVDEVADVAPPAALARAEALASASASALARHARARLVAAAIGAGEAAQRAPEPDAGRSRTERAPRPRPARTPDLAAAAAEPVQAQPVDSAPAPAERATDTGDAPAAAPPASAAAAPTPTEPASGLAPDASAGDDDTGEWGLGLRPR